MIDVIHLTLTGTHRDGEWLRVRRWGMHFADLRTIEQLAEVVDLATEQLSIPVDQDRSGGFRFGLLPGPLDGFSVDEGRACPDQGDEVGRVHAAPAVLR
jgi:hypothetical protein